MENNTETNVRSVLSFFLEKGKKGDSLITDQPPSQCVDRAIKAKRKVSTEVCLLIANKDAERPITRRVTEVTMIK